MTLMLVTETHKHVKSDLKMLDEVMEKRKMQINWAKITC